MKNFGSSISALAYPLHCISGDGCNCSLPKESHELGSHRSRQVVFYLILQYITLTRIEICTKGSFSIIPLVNNNYLLMNVIITIE